MIVEKNELAKRISQLKGIVQKQTNSTAIQGILCKDGYLIASNSELTVKAKLEGMEDDLFIIPHKAFELINSLPSGEVSIECNDDTVTIRMGKIKNKFKTSPVEQFSYQRDSITDENNASINADKMKESIAHVLYVIPAAGRNPMMTGMLLEADGENLNFVGLDGHRISWDCMPFEKTFKLIIPRAAVEKILQLDLQGEIYISYDKHGAVFKTDSYEIYTRIIAGDYFPYKKLFGEGNIGTIADRRMLLDAINRARLCGAAEDKEPVMLTLDGATMNISYQNSLANYDEDVAMQKEVTEGLKIAFAPKLFLETLKSFSCENISLDFSTKTTPLIIRAENSDMKALVLPVNFKER